MKPKLWLGLLLALAACSDSGADGARNLILVTLDTTRADALGCYGAPGDPSPNLDRIASEGVLYENAYTAVPMTLPSHCSMMTGLYPPRHTVRDNAYWPLPSSALTVAEAAGEEGLETAAFLAAVVLDRPFGLDQGFDVYDVPTPQSGDALHGERAGAEVVDRALDWLGRRDPARPFLLWVHLFDPHAPYTPPAGWRDDLNPYAAEVALMDHHLGRLFDSLRARGELDRSLLLVVGDHGEAFGEHGELAHGDLCYEPTMKVPLLLRRPRGAGGGQRSAAMASIVDVHPTLLDALGLESDPDLDGRSLLAGAPPADHGVYVESYAGYFSQGWSPLAGWIDARGKYLHSSDPELYDLEQDPGELHDLAGKRPDELRRYRLALSSVFERPTLAAEHNQDLSAELTQQIRGLGYAALGGAYDKVPHPLAPSDRPSPKAMAIYSQPTVEAAAKALEGDYAEAERELREILAHNPLNFVALHHLAFALMRQNRPEDAIEPLQTLLREGPKKAEWFSQLALCFNRLGRNDEAIDALKSAVAVEPENEANREALLQLLDFEGRAAEAREYVR